MAVESTVNPFCQIEYVSSDSDVGSAAIVLERNALTAELQFSPQSPNLDSRRTSED